MMFRSRDHETHLHATRSFEPTKRAKIKLDTFDLKILDVLQRDGKITKARLSNHVGLSSTPCFNRVQNLEKVGLIKGYSADIAIQKLGPSVMAIVAVNIDLNFVRCSAIFEREIRTDRRVLECYQIGGECDYILKVIVADLEEYRLWLDKFMTDRFHVARLTSYLSLRQVKSVREFPLDVLVGTRQNTIGEKICYKGD